MNSIVKLGKDRMEKWNETSVIYKFNCDKCSSVYVGETKRCFKTRINEHKKSVIDGLKLEDFQKLLPVPQKESNRDKRRISEMLHISFIDNTINRQEDTIFKQLL